MRALSSNVRPEAAAATLRARGNARAAGALPFILLMLASTPVFAGFVYETEGEFLSTGDFNGDGFSDVVVLDKLTGNARVGYQDANGALTWSAALVTGAARPDGFTVGRFLQNDRDAIALTSRELNHVHLVDLSSASNGPAVKVVNPQGVGPYLLVGLSAPFGQPTLPAWVATASDGSAHDPGVTLVELFAFIAESLTYYQDTVADESYLVRGNSLQLGADPTTLAAAIRRGSNDQFVAYSFFNGISLALNRSNLPPASEYVFGRFNGETYPRFLFYVPGQSNITVQRLVDNGGGLEFGSPTVTAFDGPVQSVYVVEEGADGLAMIRFGDGVAGARLPPGSDQLQTAYHFGVGVGGNVPSGVVPLGTGRFALLSALANSLSSVRAQVFTRSGSSYVETSSSSLPATATFRTRANVWLFASEPFVSSQPGFIASLNGGDWTDSLAGLPGALSAVVESDRGSTSGLGGAATNPLGAAPPGAAFGIPNQYHPSISLFSYSSPYIAEPVRVTISPPPGNYSPPIQISFTTGNPTDKSFYRIGTSNAWQQYTAPFSLSSDAQIDYYGTTTSGSARSSLKSANYSLAVGPLPPVVNTGTGETNNPPGGIGGTNNFQLSSSGTVFYGRRNGSTGTVWAINLDGTADQLITFGARPRVSPDGRYLAFLREGSPFANQGNLWVRDLLTSAEARLFLNSSTLVSCDWDVAGTHVVFDYSCHLWSVGLDGTAAGFSLATDCDAHAPVVNPLDGRVAFHNVGLSSFRRGLWVTSPDVATDQRLNVFVAGETWPAWSPDGQRLSFVSGNNFSSLDAGKDLYLVKADGTELRQITAFRNVGDGFPHGAIWSPAGNALIGAGSVNGVNGIYLLPLTADLSACAGPPLRLPTQPGDAIDFVGSIRVAPTPPELYSRRDTDEVVVFWRASFVNWLLESSDQPGSGATWTMVPGPFVTVGDFLEHHLPDASLAATQFYRLRRP